VAQPLRPPGAAGVKEELRAAVGKVGLLKHQVVLVGRVHDRNVLDQLVLRERPPDLPGAWQKGEGEHSVSPTSRTCGPWLKPTHRGGGLCRHGLPSLLARCVRLEQDGQNAIEPGTRRRASQPHHRGQSAPTDNATVHATHEFGSVRGRGLTVPGRQGLRVPARVGILGRRGRHHMYRSAAIGRRARLQSRATNRNLQRVQLQAPIDRVRAHYRHPHTSTTAWFRSCALSSMTTARTS